MENHRYDIFSFAITVQGPASTIFAYRSLLKIRKSKALISTRMKLLTHDNVLAKQYLEKLRKEQVSIDWAHRVLINTIRQQRMLKMMAIADDKHFNYDNGDDLVDFIASEMQKEGLDLNNEKDLDSYLNTKFM